MNKLFKLILLIGVFQFFMNIVLASSDCPFTIQDAKARMDTCGIINITKDYPLEITFTECKIIKVDFYLYNKNDGSTLDYIPPFGCHILNNSLMCNDNYISFGSYLKPNITYIPNVECDSKVISYRPQIIVSDKIFLEEITPPLIPPTKNSIDGDKNQTPKNETTSTTTNDPIIKTIWEKMIEIIINKIAYVFIASIILMILIIFVGPKKTKEIFNETNFVKKSKKYWKIIKGKK
ncbi:hypothetical protein HYX00_04100 [Candidatus Woesearchaeota archaeon]|nr:hypothetical protein [Candidatus Woesearchaeota archaeon]